MSNLYSNLNSIAFRVCDNYYREEVPIFNFSVEDNFYR